MLQNDVCVVLNMDRFELLDPVNETSAVQSLHLLSCRAFEWLQITIKKLKNSSVGQKLNFNTNNCCSRMSAN